MILIGNGRSAKSVRQWVLLTRFAAFLQDVLAGLVTLKSLGRSRQQGEKIGEISEAYRKATFCAEMGLHFVAGAGACGNDLDRHGGGRAGAAAL